MRIIDSDPGHEFTGVVHHPRLDLHYEEGLPVKAVVLDVDPPEIEIRIWRTPAEWWVDYRASLLTRSALSDTLTELGRLRLSLELLAVTALIGLCWTAAVLAGLALFAGALGLFF